MKPSWIYVPHENEEYSDYQAAALLVRQAVNALPGAIEKPDVWVYEVCTPIQKMDHIVDISSYVDINRCAIQAHKSQCSVMKFNGAIFSTKSLPLRDT